MATIYYRKSLMELDELEAAQCYFDCVDLISNCPSNGIIVGRYSMIPFYFDQQRDLENTGALLINSYQQHLYIADLGNYIQDLRELTPYTWKDLNLLPDEGPFVLKGETNSRKSHWKRDMFAQTKTDAIQIANRLSDDSLIGLQKIYVRQYIPLFKYMDGVNGMPVTKEFRFFVSFGKIISGGFYWQNYIDDIGFTPSPDEVPLDFLSEVIKRVGTQSNFYTIDVAQTVEGNWIIIELNEGQQAGLSCNDPMKLYKALAESIQENFIS